MIELSIRDTNKIRASLGLRLIPDPNDSGTGAVQDKTIIAVNNLAKLTGHSKTETARHEDEVVVPSEVSESKPVLQNAEQSTSSWLEKLKSKKLARKPDTESHTTQNSNTQVAVPLESEKTSQNIVDHPTPKKSSQSKSRGKDVVVKKTGHIGHSIDDFDPLVEADDTSAPKFASNDYSAKPVKFKPRKLKGTKRQKLPAGDYSIGASEIAVDELDLEHVLEQSRARQRKVKTAEEIAAEVSKSTGEKSTHDGITVNKTLTFLETLKHKDSSVAPNEDVMQEPIQIKDANNDDEAAQSDTHARVPPLSQKETVPSRQIPDTDSSGLAATLSLLKSKGVVRTDEGYLEKKRNYEWARKTRETTLARKTELRELESQYSQLDDETRELQNMQTAREDAEYAKERYKDYRPRVDLTYRDEEGNVLSSKEQWKRLGRGFHGNSASKKRMEKRKREQDSQTAPIKDSLF